MKGTVIYKMSGSGNDFVFSDGRRDPVESWPPERIRAVCHRRTGVGADGLVVVEPGSGPGAVRFQFFNNDGSRASMCGNAALCATRLSAWLELAPPEGMRLETDAGTFETRCLPGPGELAEIRLPNVGRLDRPAIELVAGEREIALTTVGVPHLVVLVDDPAAVDVLGRGRELRLHEALKPGGANVNFVGQVNGGWAMRTYERGVEDETLACGTGAVACAALLSDLGGADLPWQVRTAAGPLLTVSCEGSGGGTVRNAVLAEPTLTGEGRLVFWGPLASRSE